MFYFTCNHGLNEDDSDVVDDDDGVPTPADMNP